MRNQRNMWHQLTGLALGVALAGLPWSASAQVGGDTPWLAWVGCWAGSEVTDDQGQTQDFTVCFQPTADPEVIELVTYENGELLNLEELVADGTPTAIAEGGCEGERA